MLSLVSLISIFSLNAQTTKSTNPYGDDDDTDVNIGSDIFTDFNEDVESNQVYEDERFYRYGRFFSFNVGMGMTRFTGNRGAAYENDDPTFHMSFNYFANFQLSFTLGIEYSKHTMIVDTFVNGYDSTIVGAIEVQMMRPFFGLRYYLDTSNLGTAITYANPYLTGRFEYWYQTNKFRELSPPEKQKGGGVGFAVGFGLEFPVIIRKGYINLEWLFHTANLFDKNTSDYQQITDSTRIPSGGQSLYGYEDLTGYIWSLVLSYNFTW